MAKKKWYKRRWFKITAITFGIIFLGLTITDIYFRTLPVPECEDGSGGPAIKCPFLNIAKPSTDNIDAFADGCSEAGMSYQMAIGAAVQVGLGQKGVWRMLLGAAPDIYDLEHVNGVSHCDRYNRYPEAVEQMLKEREIEGQVTMKDLVEVKEWIAGQEGVEVNSASRQETALLFGYAGGDLETQKVYTADILLLMQGQAPTRGGTMDISLFNEAQDLASWK